MQSIDDITRVLEDHKIILKERYNVTEIGVFGSFARNEAGPDSDIDIFVKYSILPDLITMIDLEMFLEDILGRKVDLVEKTSIRKELAEDILLEAVVL